MRVVHWAWLESSSTRGRLGHLEPTSPLDMLVLYRAAAATFRDWRPEVSRTEELGQSDRILNRELARQRLDSIADPQRAALATRFANQVMELAESAAADQDLDYFVELFLRGIQENEVVAGIHSGSISRESRQLTDLDLW